MITTLAEKGYTYDDLDNRLNHLYSDPLIVPVKDIQNVNHPRWFTSNKKIVDVPTTLSIYRIIRISSIAYWSGLISRFVNTRITIVVIISIIAFVIINSLKSIYFNNLL